ncbi:MAG TPA: cysteine desulfurase family protein [Elusimicrobiales bacterium]|nr:cysteine desulfurase family protein [Elusimicrobiales bacterium]
MLLYLDNAATTRPDNRVLALMAEIDRHCYGNDSAVHVMGVAAAKRVERARLAIAACLAADPDEIIFTSGGTEANNMALSGAPAAAGPRKNHIIISAMEHASVNNPALRLKAAGAALTLVKPGRNGIIDPAGIKKALRPATALVSVMHANNETGAVQPIAEIGALCRARGVLFHSDACQSFTKTGLDVKEQHLDLLTINSHKIHGPKGVGALYIRKGLKLPSLLAGGGQERGLRPGTRNSSAIAGFGLAAELAAPAQAKKVAALRDLFWAELSGRLPGATLNCAAAPRLCGILSVTLPWIPGAAALLQALSARGVCLSAGSACAAGKTTPSAALKAIGLSDAQALRTIRVSLSRFTTEKEIMLAVKEIAALAGKGKGRHAR